MSFDFPYGKKDLKSLSPEFKISAVVADGMWYSLTKWRKIAKVTENEINKWVEENLASGYLLQSPTGAKSFRIAHDNVIDWHEEHGLEVGDPIFDFIYPARVWDGMTEVEGFLNAPLREIGVVTFECSSDVAAEVAVKLKYVARVRENEPGQYKAYCLSADYVKPIIQAVFNNYNVYKASRIYTRGSSKRRELVDFSSVFAHNMINFYRTAAKSLLKREMETIKIYVPEPQDQESQIVSWVLTAIEKFDETSSVPFNGYLNAVLPRWTYDLPNLKLGYNLSNFQRSRAKAIKSLREKTGRTDMNFSALQLSSEMGMRISDFTNLEERHHVWMKTKNASSITWEESSEEKSGEHILGAVGASTTSRTNFEQSHKLSHALVSAALKTNCFDDAMNIISQVGRDEINLNKISETSPEFIIELGAILGMD